MCVWSKRNPTRAGKFLAPWSHRNARVQRALNLMFVFFSNRVGLAGSLLVSGALTLILLYACSGY